MNDKERRNFLLKEVQKRIVGPGYTEEIYACDNDYSDEILDNRSHRIYSAGILFPQDSIELNSDSNEFDGETILDNEEDSSVSADNLSGETTYDLEESDDTEESCLEDKNPNDEDNNHFTPSHIGLIACLDSNVDEVSVEVKYGQYYLVQREDYERDVHVKLGRCTVNQIKETFDYYDRYAQETIKSIGVNSIKDIFTIDENHLWVSPKGVFEIAIVQTDGSIKKRNLRPGDFPSLLQNKAARILIEILEHPTITKSIDGLLTWEDFKNQLAIFSDFPAIKELLYNNNIKTLEEIITYDEEKKSVIVCTGVFKLEDSYNLRDILYKDDPVRNELLDKLLKPILFKRKQNSFSYPIKLSEKTTVENDDIKIVWKIIPSRYKHNQKYLRILLTNKHKTSSNTSYESFLHQAELKVVSPGLRSYSEPHHSAIEDDEYELNEVLYADELVYAKGVNCAATWDVSNNPNWVKTTYMPQKEVRSFATTSKDKDVNDACKIFDMTIWSELSKEIILDRFRKMSKSYAAWQNNQIKMARDNMDVLKTTIDDQKRFHERLIQNIDYLAENKRAYECFLLANTAMYIQMILSRDSNFNPKGQKPNEYVESNLFNEGAWDYFSNNSTSLDPQPSYRPFQLAFLLMNIKSTFEKNDMNRNEIVDLIWFPTGGGKTEAYLALTALTIAERRTSEETNVKGVSVIMRYTLRLLTSQQFERASFLICSLEFLRKELLKRGIKSLSLGKDEISIGMWIGKSSTPNDVTDLSKGVYKKFFESLNGDKKKNIDPEIPQSNPFPVSYCPWCGCNLVGSVGGSIIKGYNENNGKLTCIMNNCNFNNSLPVYYVDSQLYDNPPTLLFATVDKFAQITKQNAGKLLGIGTGQRKPDLIIQDELHLISDTLGSIVGMFETMVEELCTERDNEGNIIRRPKIIASTATTRNTKNLIKQLYNRDVNCFPVSGVRYTDNFFSHVVPLENSKRLYAGFSPTGHTSAELEIRTIAAELVAKEIIIRDYLEDKNVDLMDKHAVLKKLFNNGRLIKELDKYWTLVVYYKDKKTLGRTHSRIGQEVDAAAMSMRSFMRTYPSLEFILKDFPQRLNEFTARQDSSRIKQLLNEATDPTLLYQNDKNSYRITSKMDIVQATNMISVGIDIDRWNVMIVNGQPMKTAEYIQASSRVGRTFDGLIINLLNPMRTRELSIFENYEVYHQVFYKYVEPLSATAFTEMTLQKLIANLYLSFMVLVRKKKKPVEIDESDITSFKRLLKQRCDNIGTYTGFETYMNKCIDNINDFFKDASYVNKLFSSIQVNPDIMGALQEKYNFSIMGSLRDVESNSFVLYE